MQTFLNGTPDVLGMCRKGEVLSSHSLGVDSGGEQAWDAGLVIIGKSVF